LFYPTNGIFGGARIFCSGRVVSMGRHLIKDITGLRFYNWTVISRHEGFSRINKKSRPAYWNVICDCGNKAAVSGLSLRSGRSKSCGCLKRKLFTVEQIKEIKSSKISHKEAAAKFGTRYGTIYAIRTGVLYKDVAP
jgi:hypothetical protein